MGINPIRAVDNITNSYLNYLTTTFRYADPDLQQQLRQELSTPERFIKGPILQATPPFVPGATSRELIEEGVLSSSFALLDSRVFPLDRRLYLHQEQAIRKAVDGHNIVVATGTGSGKTECFLIPILNQLVTEYEQDVLTPGVRALLLYPMNALANDQLARLRQILVNCPFITFGRYTGETLQQYSPALDNHIAIHGQEPQPNEPICRDQMRASPPHILLTNYAMLEYLLLRPQDSPFFDGNYADHWRFLVLDEVHTYAGAKGTEMAFLLRRLKDRVAQGRSLQCIATSATLGKGRQEYSEVARFASTLFAEPFEWNDADLNRQDVIEGVRLPLSITNSCWGKPDQRLYEKWQQIVTQSDETDKGSLLLQAAVANGVPTNVLRHAKAVGEKCGWRGLLYTLLQGDQRVKTLQLQLESGPEYFKHLVTAVFSQETSSFNEGQRALAALVAVANQARLGDQGQPLIPARYHFFVRAVDGAYAAFLPQPKLLLQRQPEYDTDDGKYAVFEIASCQQCGRLYVVGQTVPYGHAGRLQQTASYAGAVEHYLVLPDQEPDGLPLPDEDELVEFDVPDSEIEPENVYLLCTRCGAIAKEQSLYKPCSCPEEFYLHVVKTKTNPRGQVNPCLSCGRLSSAGMVRRFWVGTDAAASVLATALYREAEPKKREMGQPSEPLDPWSSTLLPMETDLEPRKLLIFSDSRQDAAYFAPYLEGTYQRIQRRHLILKTLDKNRSAVIGQRWRLQDLVEPLLTTAEEERIFVEESPREKYKTAWTWLLQEFLCLDRHNSLEALGLLGFGLVKQTDWSPPKALLEAPWKLTPNEVWTLFVILLNSLRVKGAIEFPSEVRPDDEVFRPRNYEFFVRSHNQTKRIYSWCAGRRRNGRLDYLLRLAASMSPSPSEEDCRLLLSNLWNNTFFPANNLSVWTNYFSRTPTKEGLLLKLRNNVWELKPCFDPKVKWYVCNKCGTVTLFNIRGVCPTYRCSGSLIPCNPADIFADNHYYRLYRQENFPAITVREHTAQLTSEAAADLQTSFVKGAVNVLSCSTTFELGVDVGELETVFLRDMPPTAANYIQRAGRAGRRTDSVAFVLTFAQHRSHDFTHFQNPLAMVAGKIKAPYLYLQNEKIARRHVYATALASFWKDHPEFFGDVDTFFFNPEGSGVNHLRHYLQCHPEHLRRSLVNILPPTLKNTLNLNQWGWVDNLFSGDEPVLENARVEIETDIDQLEQIHAKRSRQFQHSDYILKLINTLKKKNILSFLSTRNVIPKYGFPVDVVELRISHQCEEARRLELERDLRIALSEYAPGSQVIAGGKQWTSRYIKKVPNKAWQRFSYAICDYCQNYYTMRTEFDDFKSKFVLCPICQQPFKTRGIFLKPEFGFVTEGVAPKTPSDQRPERTYSTRVYYSGQARDEATLKLVQSGVQVTAIPAAAGRMAVINEARGGRFRICTTCGYSILPTEKVPRTHKTAWGDPCKGSFISGFSLGYEFMTDILRIRFDGLDSQPRGFWLSLLYALIEGLSAAFEIERDDLNGCLYSEILGTPTLILFDDVPGGAGHVRRVAEEECLREILKAAHFRLTRCTCGGKERKSSCYSCLRHYQNQFCHDELERGPVIRFLEKLQS